MLRYVREGVGRGKEAEGGEEEREERGEREARGRGEGGGHGRDVREREWKIINLSIGRYWIPQSVESRVRGSVSCEDWLLHDRQHLHVIT